MTTPDRSERLRRVRELNDHWVASNLDAASAAFAPDDRKPSSDYNLHHVELDADSAAQDEFVDAALRILSSSS